jgi:3',5'-cyclic AMP phosphodiesterase CpdA
MKGHGAELVLHGHSHLPTLYWIQGKGRQVPVVGVAAAGQGKGSRKPAAQFNLLEISGEQGGWAIRLERHGLNGGNPLPVRLSAHDLVPANTVASSS